MLWFLSPFKRAISESRGVCEPRAPEREGRSPWGVADSLTTAHLLGDNLMDVVDSAFSIHNL